MGLYLETSAMGSIGQNDPILCEWRVAIVLDAKLPSGRLANAAAVIAVGLGAALPALGGTHAQDRHGRVGSGCSRLPIPVLEADESQRIALLAKIFPLPDGAVAVPFPAFAAAVHDHAEYLATLSERDLAAEPLIGLGVAGPMRWVRSLTGSFRLLR